MMKCINQFHLPTKIRAKDRAKQLTAVLQWRQTSSSVVRPQCCGITFFSFFFFFSYLSDCIFHRIFKEIILLNQGFLPATITKNSPIFLEGLQKHFQSQDVKDAKRYGLERTPPAMYQCSVVRLVEHHSLPLLSFTILSVQQTNNSKEGPGFSFPPHILRLSSSLEFLSSSALSSWDGWTFYTQSVESGAFVGALLSLHKWQKGPGL